MSSLGCRPYWQYNVQTEYRSTKMLLGDLYNHHNTDSVFQFGLISAANMRLSTDKQSLVITNIRASQFGAYTCLASNLGGTATVTAYILDYGTLLLQVYLISHLCTNIIKLYICGSC